MTPRGVDFDPHDPLTRALRALPAPRAPRTLAPRVMAAVHARLAAPPPRTWFDWAPIWRLASVAGAVAVMVALLMVWPELRTHGPAMWGEVLRRTTEVRAAGGLGISLFGAALQTLGPLVAIFLASVTALTMVCAVVAAAVGRVALGRV